jgi:hypothetical protein
MLIPRYYAECERVVQAAVAAEGGGKDGASSGIIVRAFDHNVRSEKMHSSTSSFVFY